MKKLMNAWGWVKVIAILLIVFPLLWLADKLGMNDDPNENDKFWLN